MLSTRTLWFRATLALVSLVALGSAPSSAPAQTLTLVRSGTRNAGVGTPGFNSDSGKATAVSLNAPSYVVFDSAGNQYLSDTQNNCVRKIDASGNISTLAGLAVNGQSDTCDSSSNNAPTASQGLYRPTGLAIDSSNRLYIADSMHNCVRSLPSGATGVASLTTVAGTCGSANSATPSPNGLAIDSNHNLYISIQDTHSQPEVSTYQVLRWAPNTNLCVVAGAPSTLVPNTCSGITGNVILNAPSGLTIDAAGDLFIADTGNNCVREVEGLTRLTSAVGQCINDGSGTAVTSLHNPYGLALSLTQSLLISESNPDKVVEYVFATGSLSLAAGLPSGTAGSYNAAQDGQSALNSPLNGPRGIAVDNFGNLFLADSGNNITRKLSSNTLFPAATTINPSLALPLTFAVNHSVNFSATSSTDFAITSNTCVGSLAPTTPGTPPATCQVFVRFDPTRPGLRRGSIQLTDSITGKTFTQGLQAVGTGAMGVFTPGTVNTLASGIPSPSAVTVDSTGNAYVLVDGTTQGTATILRIPSGGGSPQIAVPQGVGLLTPTAIAVNAAGDIFVADALNETVSRFGVDGTINTKYVVGLDTPTAISVDGSDNLYIAQSGYSHNVIEVYASGIQRIIAGSGNISPADGVPAVSAGFDFPRAISIDYNGNLYVVDSGAHYVYSIDKSGIIHKIAGNGTTTTTDPTQATGTALISASSLTVDAAANVYIADSTANRIYSVSTSGIGGSNITTVLGTDSSGNSGDGGYSTLATINNPMGVAVDGSGNLFVIDNGNGSVRAVTYPAPTLAFGSVLIGHTSSVALQNLSNLGTDPLNLTTPISTSDPHFAVDTNTTTCGTNLLTASVCSLGFTATPTTNGPAVATSTLVSNSYTSTQSITLKVTGKAIAAPKYIPMSQTEVYSHPFTETLNMVMSGPPPTGTLTFTSGPLVLCTLTGTFSSSNTCNAPNSNLVVGTYPVTFTYSGDNTYPRAVGSMSLSVTPDTIDVTLPPQNEVYGQPFPENFNFAGLGAVFPTGTITFTTGGKTLCTLTGTFGYTNTCNAPTSGLAAGTYVVTFTYSGDSNYYPATGTVTLTVSPIPATITVNNATRLYGAPNPVFTGTITGIINGDNVSAVYSTMANLTSSVGTYPITATLTGPAAGNYTVKVITGTLTVSPASLTVTVADATRLYGAPNPTFTSTVTGALNDDTFVNTYSTPATVTSPVKTYPITDVVSGPAASNYTIMVIPGTLTVTPAPLSVTVGSPTRPYGSPNPTFTSTIVGALNGDTFVNTYSTPAVTNSPVGMYPINDVVSGPAASNYDISVTPGILTITQNLNSLIINVDDKSRTYGAPNPTLTGTVTGVLPGDDVIVTFFTTATPTSDAGKYPIGANVSGTSAGNYVAQVRPGTLVISPAATTTTIATSGSPAVAGINVIFTSTVTTAVGVPVGSVNFSDGTTVLGTVAVNSAGVATYTTSTLAAGSHTITAAFVANTDFTASSASLTQVITVATGSFTISASPAAQVIHGAGTTIYQVTLNAVGAFAGQVALTCAGLPNDATCTFGSNPTLATGGTATTTMTVTTTANDAQLSKPPTLNPKDLMPITVAAVFPVELTGLGVLVAGFRRRKTLGAQRMRLLLIIMCTLGILSLVGCGCPSTAFQTYTINITGTSVTFPAPPQTTSVVLSVGSQ